MLILALAVIVLLPLAIGVAFLVRFITVSED